MIRLLIACLPALACAAFAQTPSPIHEPRVDLLLWPEGAMPGEHTSEPESTERNGEIITHISTPLITVYPAAASSKPVAAVLICPGGGYTNLAYTKEGSEVAAWLNSIGITGIVLKYRIPQNRDGAFDDLQRAMRLVRGNAKKWNLDPHKIGVMGFSAGGHLAARLSGNHSHATYKDIDTVDREALRPDFTLLVYPAYLDHNGLLAPEFSQGKDFPPLFIVHTDDDLKFVNGSKLFSAFLEQTHTPHEFFLLPTGGHGYGLRSAKEIKVWPEKAQVWLKSIKVL